MTRTFYDLLNPIILKYVPLTNFTPRKFPPWFNVELKNLVFMKRVYHALWVSTNDLKFFIEFKRLRASAKKLSRKCYKLYIDKVQISCREDPGSFFSYLKLKNKNSSFPEQMTYGTAVSEGPFESVNLFAQFFNSVYSHYDDHDDNIIPFGPFNSCLMINDEDILTNSKFIKEKGSCGSDGIPPVFLKKCLHSLLIPLKIIYQKSLDTATFPNFWKKSFITPVFKNGDRNEVGNYRPISIISVFSKILESIFYTKLYGRVSSLIKINQHGFIKGLSVTTNLSIYTDFYITFISLHRFCVIRQHVQGSRTNN